MALVICQGCNGEFSNFSSVCPFCNAPSELATPADNPLAPLGLTTAQTVIVGVSEMSSQLVATLSFRLFAPEWGISTLNRFQKNNAAFEARRRGKL